MTGLFIRLYLDEDVDVHVAEMVRAHGFDALTTREARRLGDSDAAQLTFATAEGRVFPTHPGIPAGEVRTLSSRVHQLTACPPVPGLG